MPKVIRACGFPVFFGIRELRLGMFPLFPHTDGQKASLDPQQEKTNMGPLLSSKLSSTKTLTVGRGLPSMLCIATPHAVEMEILHDPENPVPELWYCSTLRSCQVSSINSSRLLHTPQHMDPKSRECPGKLSTNFLLYQAKSSP